MLLFCGKNREKFSIYDGYFLHVQLMYIPVTPQVTSAYVSVSSMCHGTENKLYQDRVKLYQDRVKRVL